MTASDTDALRTELQAAGLRATGARVAVLRVLRSGRYVLGPETVAFEAELAALVGTRFALGVASGSDALALSLRALGIGAGDEVVTSPFTYFATVEAILLVGARPVFCDVEPGDLPDRRGARSLRAGGRGAGHRGQPGRAPGRRLGGCGLLQLLSVKEPRRGGRRWRSDE